MLIPVLPSSDRTGQLRAVRRRFRVQRLLTWVGLPLTVVAIALSIAAASAERLVFWYIRPSRPFRDERVPAPPNYEDERFWAALPALATEASVVPVGAGPDRQQTAIADVFFIHGTGFLSSENWNSSMDPTSAAAEQTRAMLAWQASAFNECCRVYAPHYREATLDAFFDRANGQKALQIAYEDVARAFDHFLRIHHQGRPFIVAGHSQGAFHALRLLEEKIEGTALFDQFVAAYAPGMPVPLDKFGRSFTRVKPCSSATDLGCVASWNTYREGGSPEETLRTVQIWYKEGWEPSAGKDTLCVNPLTWNRDETEATAEANLGAIAQEYPSALKALLTRKGTGATFTNVAAPSRQKTGARCRKGFLFVPDQGKEYVTVFGGGYHNYDYTLFYMNIRKNAADRVAAFRDRGAPNAPTFGSP